jgi:hypothetical protein
MPILPVSNDVTGLRNLERHPVNKLEDLQKWSRWYRGRRNPDVVIGGDYLSRWWIIPRNDYMNIYLHVLHRDDDDRALHDHPADNTSLIIDGSYREITPEGEFLREPGQIVHRKAADPHRLELVTEECVSLFYMGPKYRQWGFHCPQGWVQWNLFVDPDNPELAGPGCG